MNIVLLNCIIIILSSIAFIIKIVHKLYRPMQI